MVEGFDGRNNESLPHLLGVRGIPHLPTGPSAIRTYMVPPLPAAGRHSRGTAGAAEAARCRGSAGPAVRAGAASRLPPRRNVAEPGVLLLRPFVSPRSRRRPPRPQSRSRRTRPPLPGGTPPAGAARLGSGRPCPQPQQAGTRPFPAPRCQNARQRLPGAARSASPRRRNNASRERCRPPAGSPHPGAVLTARSRSPSDVAAAAVRPQLPHRREDARPRMRRHHHGRRRLVGQGGAGTRGHVGAHPAGAVLAPGRVRASGGGGGAERCPAVRGCLAGSGGEETTRKRRAVVADRGACPPFFVAGREGLRCCGSERGSAWPSGARCRGGDRTAASPGPICGALREGERGGGKRRWAARAGTQRPSVAGPFSLRVPAVAAGAAPDSGERHGLARPERETLRYSHNAFCCLTSLRFNRTSHLTAARYECFWHVPCGHAGPMRQPGLADGSRLEFPQ